MNRSIHVLYMVIFINTDTKECKPKVEVLFIDDLEDVCVIARNFLERSGRMHLNTALNTTEARKILQEKHMDIIVCDNHMPSETGLEFLYKLRREGSKIPFILLTGEGNAEIVIEAFRGGADFYLTKNSNNMYQELEILMNQAIYKRSVEKALEDKNDELRLLLQQMMTAQDEISAHLCRIRCVQLT